MGNPISASCCHREGLGLCTATLGQHLTDPGLGTSCLSRLSARESESLLTEARSHWAPATRPAQCPGPNRACALLSEKDENAFLIEDKGFTGNSPPMFSHLKTIYYLEFRGDGAPFQGRALSASPCLHDTLPLHSSSKNRKIFLLIYSSGCFCTKFIKTKERKEILKHL